MCAPPARTLNLAGMAYLDHAATTPMRQCAVDVWVEHSGALNAGSTCPRVRHQLDRGLRELAGGGSRHDALNLAVIRLVRLAEQGHTGLTDALAELRQVFYVLTASGTGARDRSPRRIAAAGAGPSERNDRRGERRLHGPDRLS